jgi:hypothetical protein
MHVVMCLAAKPVLAHESERSASFAMSYPLPSFCMTLPLELIHYSSTIFAAEASRTELKTLALTSRVHCQIAQRVLFSTLTVGGDSNDAVALARLVYLVTHPHLARYVTDLYIAHHPCVLFEQLSMWTATVVKNVRSAHIRLRNPDAKDACSLVRLISSFKRLQYLVVASNNEPGDPFGEPPDSIIDSLSVVHLELCAEESLTPFILGAMGRTSSRKTLRSLTVDLQTVSPQKRHASKEDLEAFQDLEELNLIFDGGLANDGLPNRLGS